MPEVETMCQRLQPYVGMEARSVRPAEGEDPGRYAGQELHGPILGIFRRGKFMVFELGERALLAHNAMSGYWDDPGDPWTFDYVEGKRRSTKSDVRALIEVVGQDGRTRSIQFHDSRKFGFLHVLSRDEVQAKLKRLGPDALRTLCLWGRDVLDEEGFFAITSSTGRGIKQLLMDQSRIAGIGNIYAAEALWGAGIHPARPSDRLLGHERSDLFRGIQKVLSRALERKLSYKELTVYRRRECLACNGPIASEKLGGRTTWWCPTCQK